MKKILLIVVVAVAGSLAFGYQKTEAISGSEFSAGNIMSDSVFFNSQSLNASQIQAFFEAKLPECDTWGTKPYGGVTRAQYASTKGVSPPFVCLRDYSQSTPERQPESGLCGHLPARSTRTAAQIIDDVARACGVSQKVLIVLLQKEQGLISDDWPWPIQYRSATGYGCPDTAPCDSQYYGYFNQVYQAAKIFKWYSLNNGPNYKKGQNNYIRYSPDVSCGGSFVYIENQATAGLYNYTPYQPNSATLTVGLGQTANCGAYGNKNFWWYYRLWFGSTQSVTLPPCTESVNTTVDCVWHLRNVANDNPYLLSSVGDRNALVDGGGYAFEGTYFYGNSRLAPKPWNIAVYRLIKPNGESFLTASNAEKNSLITAGFQYKGIDFYANPASNTSNAGYSIYRLHSPSTGRHVWVTTLSQRAYYVSQGYTYEGVAFQSVSQKYQELPPPDDKVNIYRFYIASTRSHFYTSSLSERDSLISKQGLIYEGVSWFGNSSSNSKPVYRLYSSKLQKHLFTTDTGEKNSLISSGLWSNEGISHYANTFANTKPVYRLYSPSTNRHFWTNDINERNHLTVTGQFIFEGIGWYQP